MWSGKKPNTHWKDIDKNYLKNNSRYVPIQNPIESVDQLKDLPISEYHRIRQRSQAWFHVRKNHKKPLIGASSLGELLGLHTPFAYNYFGKDTKYSSNKSFKNSISFTEKKFDEASKINMEWGVNKEDNVLFSTLMFLPDVIIYETGCYIIELKDRPFDIIVSPDAIYEDMKTKRKGIMEFKALSPFIYQEKTDNYIYRKRKLPDEIIFYYLPQIYFEAMSTNLDNGYFTVYFPKTGSKIMRFSFIESYAHLCLEILSSAYKKYYIDGEKVPENDSPYNFNPMYMAFLKETKKLIKPLSIIEKSEICDLKYAVPNKLDKIFLDDEEITKDNSILQNTKIVYDKDEEDDILNIMKEDEKEVKIIVNYEKQGKTTKKEGSDFFEIKKEIKKQNKTKKNKTKKKFVSDDLEVIIID